MDKGGTVNRINSAFDRLRGSGDAALIPYLMVGHPTLEATKELLYAIVRAGADAVELGVPFSDPMADGATIQRANQSALDNGVGLADVLDLVATVRGQVAVPLILMSYCNPIYRMGFDRFAAEASLAGVDGLIVPDLPLEESSAMRQSCVESGIDLVGMVAPTSPAERIRSITRNSSGFVYCVTLNGVTGARHELSPVARPLVRQVKDYGLLPAVIGFGVSSPRQIRDARTFADGVVVASALVDRIDRARGDEVRATTDFVTELKAACRRPETDD